jgi:hypothetical protein
MTGYDLLRDAAGIVAQLDSIEGADPAELDARLTAWLDAADDKHAAYYAVSRRLDLESDECAALMAGLRKRAAYLASQQARVKALASELLAAREALGEEPRVSTPMFRAWLATTEAVSVPEDVAMLPEQYVRVKVTREADKAAIKAAIKAGESVPGAFLVQTRGVRWSG